MCVLQRQEGVGSDGALALALGVGQQVADGQLSGGEWDGGNLARGGERLQLLEVLLLLHQLVEQHLLLLLLLLRERRGRGRRQRERGKDGRSRKKTEKMGAKEERTRKRKLSQERSNLDHHLKENCS